jgi:hypothetical protein
MPWRAATVETARARFVVEAEMSDLSHAEVLQKAWYPPTHRLQVDSAFRGRAVNGHPFASRAIAGLSFASLTLE